MPEIDTLFRMLVDHGGSDLHLSSNRRPMLRRDGEIESLELPAVQQDDIVRLVGEIIPASYQAEFEDCNDTDFAYEIPGFARFRINVFRDRFGLGAVFRVIPAEVLTAEQLGLTQGVIDFCYLSKGLVVVTGPTGSGKSTTLAAMVDLINRTRPDHIITIEDPIEFVHQEQLCLINQREVKTHTRSFATALRAALRQDPYVVLVCEMRDLETIEIAIETAETGHLVFGTLHTNTAASTVDRIIDSFPTNRQNQVRSMLADSLKGAVSQTLCKRVGGGRVAAMEILIVDSAISSLIRDGKTFQIPSSMQVARGKGMVMMNDSLIDLVAGGIVEPRQAYLRAVDKVGLLSKYRDMDIEFDPASLALPVSVDANAGWQSDSDI